VKKDIEICFNILQAHFATIQNSYRLWHMDIIYEVIVACVILHSMLIEDDKNNHLEPFFQQTNLMQLKQGLTFDSFMQGTQKIENSCTHFNLRSNLVEHLWAMKGFNQVG